MSTTSSLTVPLSDADVMPDSTEARPVFTYEDGQRTDTPRKDASGHPLYAMNGVLNSEVTGVVQCGTAVCLRRLRLTPGRP
ncbi:MAG: hypothetical protein E6640_01770 [Actinomyces urogenitalis]|uniref:hypothetical protein n=1 Tax=Actinomyces urogenitalis TaxID=103621 RepID=UPI0029121AF7|nr:hypothetical protein [Actinomyces urogenitalis]MDU6150939.1 hypothetical protein [Actinomyces urogenitalis]